MEQPFGVGATAAQKLKTRLNTNTPFSVAHAANSPLGVSGCLLLNVKGTFIGMSESLRGIINYAETATSVPCDPRKNRRTILPAANIHTESRRSKCAEESEDPGLQ